MRNEVGYSLVEVMASIVILSIAIIPMVGMFDAGLRAASTSGNYDKARALANLKLEEAKGLEYEAVKNSFPSGACSLNASDTDGEDTCSSEAAPTGFPSSFTYDVEKQFMDRPDTSEPFGESPTDQNLVKITVTVKWSGNEYSTIGVVAK